MEHTTGSEFAVMNCHKSLQELQHQHIHRHHNHVINSKILNRHMHYFEVSIISILSASLQTMKLLCKLVHLIKSYTRKQKGTFFIRIITPKISTVMKLAAVSFK